MNTKMLCLGVLSMGKASGYDIGKQLEQIFGHFIDVATSGVYPALKTLYDEGLVKFEQVEQDALPNKKVYEITPEGQEVFRRALAELPPRHKIRSQFILLMFYAELLSSERLEEVLAERMNELRGWMKINREWVLDCAAPAMTPGREFIARFGHEMMATELRFLENNSPALIEALRTEHVTGE